MSLIEQIKQRCDIHEVAARLGLQRPDPHGNYRSPHHPDKNPSLQIGGRKYPDGWYDHSSGVGGDVIDLVKWSTDSDHNEAVEWLCDSFGLERRSEKKTLPGPDKSLAEYIADQCRRSNPDPAIEYLNGRGIPPDLVRRAIKLGAVGYNDYTHPGRIAGTSGYGGPATAFIVRSLNPGRIVGVDLRYHDPAMNGDNKTKSVGDKVGCPWFMDGAALKRSHTVVIVESAINALSAETAFAHGDLLSGWSAIATRGTATVDGLDVRWMRGKRVVLCMDNDEPDDKGHCPGQEAAWKLHSLLIAEGIACHFVDQDDWPCNDLNNLLTQQNVQVVGRALQKFSPWALPGVPAKAKKGRVRVYLPPADFSLYYRFRVREDFTSWVEIKEGEEGEEQCTPRDVAGFRIASIAHVKVANYVATTTGESDHQPTPLLAVSAQTPFHGNDLIREVTKYKNLNNAEWWKSLGPIFRPAEFMRLVTIWGRAARIEQINAVNWVGICYKDGKLRVNEGTDCYFQDPEQQCVYHNFRFPSGDIRSAAPILRAFHRTFQANAALQLLVWTLGAHLKVILSFWPHLMLQAEKGRGKTTLIERLSRATGLRMMSGQSLETGFRVVTSISYTSQPICWDEMSSRRQDKIDQAVGLLQEAYKFTQTRRGSALLEFVLSAPVLLSGEDVPIKSLLGKVVRAQLREKGPLIPEDLPPFPLRPWLDYITRLDLKQVKALYQNLLTDCQRQCRAPMRDEGAKRIVQNYAALALAWGLLLNFSGCSEAEFNFMSDLIRQMNSYIAETEAEREPWVWITEIILNEIAAKAFPYPYCIDTVNGEEALLIRTSHMMHHLATKPGLKSLFDGMPVKSDRVYKQQLKNAGVVAAERTDARVGGQRVCHMVALSIGKLAEFGLYPEIPPPN